MHAQSTHIPLSAVLIARNEAFNIDACLESLAWADEIIVADTGSTDDTCTRALKHANVRLFHISFEGYAAAKQKALGFASHDWILSIDCDERVSESLAQEIRIGIGTNSRGVAFSVSRRNHFLGRPINGCGWWPDRVVRIFRKSEGGFGEEIVHEAVSLNEGVLLRELTYPLQHFSYRSVAQFFQKQLSYGALGAAELARKNARPSVLAAVFRPLAAFFRVYVLRSGWRDGFAGYLIAGGVAVSTLVKYGLHALETHEKN